MHDRQLQQDLSYLFAYQRSRVERTLNARLAQLRQRLTEGRYTLEIRGRSVEPAQIALDRLPVSSGDGVVAQRQRE